MGCHLKKCTCVLGIINNIIEISSFLRRLHVSTSLCTLALTGTKFDLHGIELALIKRIRCKKFYAFLMFCIVLMTWTKKKKSWSQKPPIKLKDTRVRLLLFLRRSQRRIHVKIFARVVLILLVWTKTFVKLKVWTYY